MAGKGLISDLRGREGVHTGNGGEYTPDAGIRGTGGGGVSIT